MSRTVSSTNCLRVAVFDTTALLVAIFIVGLWVVLFEMLSAVASSTLCLLQTTLNTTALLVTSLVVGLCVVLFEMLRAVASSILRPASYCLWTVFDTAFHTAADSLPLAPDASDFSSKLLLQL